MNDMFVTFFGTGLWAVIKAVLILLLAFLVAGIVKSLVVKLLTKTKLSVLLGKTDASTDGGKRMLEHIGKLVHLVVFLLFVPVAGNGRHRSGRDCKTVLYTRLHRICADSDSCHYFRIAGT